MADEEDLHKGPLVDRLSNKNWKVRRAAFEELQQKFKEATDNAIFDEYAPKFKKIIEDKNAAAQEKGLEALLTWIDRAENPTKLNNLSQPLAVNCFGGRSNTVQKAVDALMLFIEVDKTGEPVVTALLPECFNKQWKISATSISTIALALKTFGSKVVPLKPILKEVTKMFEDSNAKVREEAQKLVIEMYRWAGAALKPTVDTLRPAQIKDLNAAFEQLPKTKAAPEKRLRCEQAQEEEEETSGRASHGAGGGGGGGDDEEEDAAGMDAYDLAEPVDILSKLPGDWFDKIASPKWKERHEQMDALLSLLNTPRLQPGDYKELTRALKKIIEKDANIGMVIKAAQAAGFLTKGLRQNFSAEAKHLVPALLAKFKDQKATVATAIHDALAEMMNVCFALPDLSEDLPPAADAKAPSAREQTLVFVTRFIEKSKRAPVGQSIKVLGPLFLKAMDDGTPEVREAAYKGLGTLVGKVGERPLSPYLSKLDGIKEKRVKENYPEKIFTGTLVLNPQAAKPQATSAKKPVGKQAAPEKKGPAPSSNKQKLAAQPKAPASTPASAPPVSKSAAPAPKPAAPAPKPEAPAPKPKPKPVIPTELPLISAEEGMEKAAASLPETTLPLLEDAVWKQRLAGMDELIGQLDQILSKDEALMVQVVLRLIEQKPGFKDSNFQVNQKVFQTVTRLAKSQFFTKSMAELIMAALVEKIGDIKLRNAVLECLNGVVEAVGLDFVLREVYKHSAENKNPKSANEILAWVGTAIEDFGIQGPPAPVDIKLLVDFIKLSLENSNSMVRSAATKALTKVFILVGESIKEHLADVKPALMTTIDKEFTKYANAKPDPPTKFYRQKEAVVPVEEAEEVVPEVQAEEKPKAVAAAAAPSKGRVAPATDDSWVEGAVDEYDNEEAQEEQSKPARADINPLLTPQLLAELADPKDWKLRKEALDKIRRILSEADMRVQANCLANLMPRLGARMKDTNKNLVLYTVKLLGILATAVGQEIEAHVKTTVPLILANYTDQKQTMRDTVTKALDQWAAEVGAESLMPYFPQAVVIESSAARKDALAWLVAHKQDLGKAPENAKVLLKPTIIALQDKTTDVRRLAEELLEDLFARIDIESIRTVCKDIKQAALRQQVVAIAKKARSAASGTSSESKAAVEKAPSVAAKSSGSITPGSTKSRTSTSATISASTTNLRSAANLGSKAPSPNTRTVSASQMSRLPLVPNEDKSKRQRQDDSISDEGRGWTFTKAPKPEHAQHLQQQAKPYLSEGLYSKMFSKDFRKHREALQELTEAVSEHPEPAKQNADILLKWSTLRLFDANAATQSKTLSFLVHLFELFDANDYHLTDYEAGIILPVLIECMGQGEAMQVGVAGLLQLVPRVYPSSKWFGLLLNAGLINSKSPRTHAECLEQMALMLRKQGLTVCHNPSVVFPQIVHFVSDKVASVRNAALSVIQQAHLHVGDDLWLYTGSLSETQRALIHQKMGGDSPLRTAPPASRQEETPEPATLRSRGSSTRETADQEEETQKGKKRTPAPRDPSPASSAARTKTALSSGSSKSAIDVRAAKPVVATTTKPKAASEEGVAVTVPKSFSLELDKLAAPTAKLKKEISRVKPALEPAQTSAITAPTPSLPSRLAARTPVDTSSSPSPSPSSSSSSSLSSSSSTLNPHMVFVQAWVKELESGLVDSMIATCKAILEKLAESGAPFVGCSDGLVKTLAGCLNSTLRRKDFSVDKNREFKYFVNVLFKLFSQVPIAVGINRESSKLVLRSLMTAFVDPAVAPRSDTDTANNLYKGIQLATMKVLRNTDQTAIFTTLMEMLDDVLSEADSDSAPKGFAEVLVKALAIVIQHIKDTIDDLNIDQVLRDINAFLELHYGRENESSMSKLRKESIHLCQSAVKEIIIIKGRSGVSRHLSLVPVAKYPTPVIVRVINNILKETYGSGETIAVQDVGSVEEEDPRFAAKIELRRIMQGLSSTDRQQAIRDLYHFKTKHPEIDIQPYLSTATTQFQSYVRRALMAVEEKENIPVRSDLTNSSASSVTEDVYMDKLRALQKRYGHTAGKHAPAPTPSVDLSATSTTKTAAANGSIQDLRLRLHTVLRSAGVSSTGATAQQPLSSLTSEGGQLPPADATNPPSSAELYSLDQLKARLARIKQIAAPNTQEDR